MQPRLTSAVVVQEGNKFLLGRRNKVNANGLWVFPGGGVDFGEKAETAAKREIKEEANIDVNIKKLLCVKEIINVPGEYHSVVFFHLAEMEEGQELTSSDDLSEVGFFTIEEIRQMKCVQSVFDVLKEL